MVPVQKAMGPRDKEWNRRTRRKGNWFGIILEVVMNGDQVAWRQSRLPEFFAFKQVH